MMDHALFVIAKQPLVGVTKTRLCPPLSHQAAATLYEGFLRDTLEIMAQVEGVRTGIAYMPEDAGAYFHTLAPAMEAIPQRGANLNERLSNLISDVLAGGARSVVVINSDSPTLSPKYVQHAFALLDAGYDLVLGPCDDGGYYLIGLKQAHPRLLLDVVMSTSNVLLDTMMIANQLRLRATLLARWYDVDTIADLERLREELLQADPSVAQHTRSCLQMLPSVI